MSRPNGRRQRAIEGLATALQECFDASIDVAEKRFEKRMEPRFEKIDTRLDKQDDTLRMIWTQCGGKSDQRLPVDD
ncbi:MAG: hypothetical protein OXC08_14575 [Thiotrichales bacterium]|nr:hypothetical protein [Thiotrichales bacterium]